jgi:hypothetical protein
MYPCWGIPGWSPLVWVSSVLFSLNAACICLQGLGYMHQNKGWACDPPGRHYALLPEFGSWLCLLLARCTVSGVMYVCCCHFLVCPSLSSQQRLSGTVYCQVRVCVTNKTNRHSFSSLTGRSGQLASGQQVHVQALTDSISGLQSSNISVCCGDVDNVWMVLFGVGSNVRCLALSYMCTLYGWRPALH